MLEPTTTTAMMDKDNNIVKTGKEISILDPRGDRTTSSINVRSEECRKCSDTEGVSPTRGVSHRSPRHIIITLYRELGMMVARAASLVEENAVETFASDLVEACLIRPLGDCLVAFN
jgi:hypothetical protein